MSQQPPVNIAAMGGPVGGAAVNAGTPTNSADNPNNSNFTKKLNTAIYDYLLRNKLYDIARSFSKELPIDTKPDTKSSPNQRNGQQMNGVDDAMEDSSNDAVLQRPEDLPLPNNMVEGPFLADWWCQFWEIYFCQRNKGGKNGTQNYIGVQRMAQKGRQSMMSAMDPNSMNNLRGYNNMMQGINNGMGMNPTDLKRTAMQNQQRNLTPQQMQHMKNMAAQQNNQMMQGNQMERQGSQMDMSGPRSGSPGSGDAPSPKRQRIEGNMQQMNQGRPGQPGQMQGNQVGPNPDVPQPDPARLNQTREILRNRGIPPESISTEKMLQLTMQPTNIQAQSVDVYSTSLGHHQTKQMNDLKSDVNKGMNPNMGPGGAQGSPMSQPGMDGATGEFYAAANGRMPMPQNAAAAAAAGQAGNSNGNHALQDYQMQLMLLEQQNKKRLLMARQEQDSMSHPGVVGPGPNGQFNSIMSQRGSQGGTSSSLTHLHTQLALSAQSQATYERLYTDSQQGSPTPGMMDPTQVPPNLRGQQMMIGPNGQQMRPPSSHPMSNMTPQQMEMMRQNMPNGQFPPGQGPQGQMMPGQQGPGQPGPGQPMGTPRQQNTTMPPPPAPANAGGTQPSSPSQPPAPPTPNQAPKAKPGAKKEAAGKKGAANKKGGAAGATPATESEQPPTPTPATPATPMNKSSFSQNQQMANGQSAAAQANAPGANQQNQNQQAAQQNAAASQQQQQQQDIAPPFGSIMGDESMNFGLDLGLGDDSALENFDFDSFLNSDGDGLNNFDAGFNLDGFDMSGIDATN